MDTSPSTLHNGMRRQLQTWRETVADRGLRLGWKTGFTVPSDQQRLNLPCAMVGYLSREHCYRSGDYYRAPASAILLVEPEVAIQIGADVSADATTEQACAAIACYSAALELVDTTRCVTDDMEAILAGNLFHDSVVLSDTQLPARDYRRDQLSISLRINGEEVRRLDLEREQERVPEDFSAIILAVANTLAAEGERLLKGDWIITGAATKPVAVSSGDEIEVEMGLLGKILFKIDQTG